MLCTSKSQCISYQHDLSVWLRKFRSQKSVVKVMEQEYKLQHLRAMVTSPQHPPDSSGSKILHYLSRLQPRIQQWHGNTFLSGLQSLNEGESSSWSLYQKTESVAWLPKWKNGGDGHGGKSMVFCMAVSYLCPRRATWALPGLTGKQPHAKKQMPCCLVKVLKDPLPPW